MHNSSGKFGCICPRLLSLRQRGGYVQVWGLFWMLDVDYSYQLLKYVKEILRNSVGEMKTGALYSQAR